MTQTPADTGHRRASRWEPQAEALFLSAPFDIRPCHLTLEPLMLYAHLLPVGLVISGGNPRASGVSALPHSAQIALSILRSHAICFPLHSLREVISNAYV